MKQAHSLRRLSLHAGACSLLALGAACGPPARRGPPMTILPTPSTSAKWPAATPA